MAGRNRMPRRPDNYRTVHEDPRLIRAPMPHPPYPRALEEELELQQRDIQRLLADNRHVIDDNVMLQRNLTAVKDEIHRLNQAIPKMHADREAHKRELMDRTLKLEADLRAMDALRSDAVQLRAEAQNLKSQRQELSSQVQNLGKDISKLQTENKIIASLKSDIDKNSKELLDARRVFEYEKKGNEEIVEQNRQLENTIVAMARELEKLRSGLISADSRARGVGGYPMANRSPETLYPVPVSGPGPGPYGDVYIPRSWGPYDQLGPPRH
ncbi:protein FLX-like 3 [Andrographis paniculata]|uniref:protein FLX-like 3 n=1 Tax=Andrographis paniculata TaxID=175694 RepID=UPI0021E80168|nr:protein FLX-like 3 [Andrographis paniculata]XP_051149553.1 protein FLX-like 3 [Andrographis paniculata]